MKKGLLIGLGILIAFLAYSTSRPERVPSKLTEIKTNSWYLENFRAWRSYLTDNVTDKEGWLEFFKAAKYAKVSEVELLEIVGHLETNHPESFELNYVLAKFHGWNTEGVSYLEKAIALKSAGEFLEEELVWAEYKLAENRADFSQVALGSGAIHKSTLNYAYNVLMSVGENGILITEAPHSTIPLWVLQDVMAVRTDVSILNLELGHDKDYLVAKLGSLALDVPEDLNALTVPSANLDREFYYALSLKRQRLEAIEDQLYVVGLASQFGAADSNYNEFLRDNLENKFLLDYLTIDFNGEPNTSTGRVLEQNYIVPFFLLKEYYDEIGNTERSGYWSEQLLKVADRSQLKSRVELMLQNRTSESSSFESVSLDIKKLDKAMIQLKGNLYAAETEVTNSQYWYYLEYLRTNNYDELFDQSIPDLSKYDDFTRQVLSNFHYSEANYRAASAKVRRADKWLKYPAIDMTYEAAKGYCEWLTAQYNQQSDRKFKKVQFRLPTQKEWTIAALGYKEFTSWNLEENTIKTWDVWIEGKGTKKSKKGLKEFKLSEYKVDYPWWYPNIDLRDKIRNQFGCYLANVKTPEEVFCKAGIKGDGFTMLSPVGTYFANRMGLYDVVGNVAEMINEEGKAMGGSYNHPAEECTITSVNSYEDSEARVGFRLFMEVIEE